MLTLIGFILGYLGVGFVFSSIGVHIAAFLRGPEAARWENMKPGDFVLSTVGWPVYAGLLFAGLLFETVIKGATKWIDFITFRAKFQRRQRDKAASIRREELYKAEKVIQERIEKEINPSALMIETQREYY